MKRCGTSQSICSEISLTQARILNKFAGTASDIDLSPEPYGDAADDDFDSSSNNGPILSDIQRAKPIIRGGEAPYKGHMIQSSSSSRIARRTKRADELFKRAHMIFEGDVRVRVMDVDRFRLDELHQYFMYTLVRRYPAETCVKVASRIALFRDKQTQHSFESMSKDVARIFGPIHGPELTALFSRCYSTIPVPFMLDYIRRFGKFSRKYIAMQVEKTLKPRLFDFVRYPGGVRPLPGIVTRPFALRSFAWLLPPSSAKRYIFQHLLAHSGDDKVIEKLRLQEVELSGALMKGNEVDPLAPKGAHLQEKLVSAWKKVERPNQLDPLEAKVLARLPASADDIIDELESHNGDSERNEESQDPFLLQKTQVHSFRSRLSPEADELTVAQEAEDKSVDFVGDDYESPDDSWWKHRRHSSHFFRYNKKAYRLSEEEGWKQVEDPRGELPEYSRAKALRLGRRNIKRTFARQARQKVRNSLINTAIRRVASQRS